MKKLTQLTLVLIAMTVAFAGCDAAKDAAKDAGGKAVEMAGGFDATGLTEKFKDITEKFTKVDEENVDELATEIKDFDGAVKKIEVDKLPEPVKKTAGTLMSGFAEKLEAAMDKVPEALRGKLEGAVKPLMEKLKAFGV